ncbi:hypothetical protein MVEG_08908 [Podila verticillata NRRL 6337]|nr:hypothetical protein MVEG_08908 [Podila verticillata NRRL 6337]
MSHFSHFATLTPKTNYIPEELEALSKSSVLTSGGGIGGLTLALLFLKPNIPFLILERAKEIKQLGTLILLSPIIVSWT